MSTGLDTVVFINRLQVNEKILMINRNFRRDLFMEMAPNTE